MTSGYGRYPLTLMLDEEYASIDHAAKTLYVYLDNLSKLAKTNNQVDENGQEYVILSIAKVRDKIHVGKDKAIKILRQLEDAKLITREPDSALKTYRIYVRHLLPETESKKRSYKPSKHTASASEKPSYDINKWYDMAKSIELDKLGFEED